MLIFSDFDGTLTTDGQIGSVFFDILAEVQRLNSELIIVSGRSLSWGHFFLTHFPITKCVMEGGGVLVYKDEEGMIREENLIDEKIIHSLASLENSLVKDIPETIMSCDSFGRRTDRAIEIYDLEDDVKDQIRNYLNSHGAHFSQSNVHLNFWMGEISKSKGVKVLMQKFYPKQNLDECLYFGDAMNDESMFEYFKHTIGVSNIQSILGQLTHKPQFVLQGKQNEEASGVLNYLKQITV